FTELSVYKEEDFGPKDLKRFRAVKAWKTGQTDLASLGKFDDNDQHYIAALRTLEVVQSENPRFDRQLAEQRRALSNIVHNKAVLIGFTATGNQDAVTTSLHPRCPGVVTHGAIFNAIITGHVWTVAPEWLTVVFIVALGWITAIIAWKFSPLGAFLIT